MSSILLTTEILSKNQGQCGEVRLAKPRHTNTDNCYAIKTIPLPHRDHSSRYSFYNTSNATPTRKKNTNPILQDAKREAKLLQTIHHPYIIRLQETFFECTAVHLVMEYASGGDLFERIVERTKLTETVTRRLTRRLFNAMHYLHHKHRMVHRDLKPENILLSSKTNDYLCKISDFGVAKIMPTEDVGLKTFCGTPQYFAPEVFRRRFTVQKRGRYDYQADVWSLGVILYICLFGMFPFGDDDEETDDNANLSYYGKLTFPCTASHSNSEMIDRSANNAKDDPGSLTIVSKAAQDMIQKLLTVNPEHRIKLSDACNHEWLQIEDGDTHRHPLRDPAINDKDKENEMNKEKHCRPQDAVVSCSPKMGTKKKKKRQNLNHTKNKKKKKDVVQSTLLGGKVIVRQDNVEDKTVTEVHDHNDKPSSFENDGNENCNTDRMQNSSSLKSSRPQQQTTLSKWIKTVAKK